MYLNYDANPGVYVDYCIATQASWKIWAVDTRERFKQIFEGLRTNTRVKKLLLRCNLLGGLTNNDLYQLASAIETNTSLEILDLRRLNGDTSYGLAAVLRAMAAHKPNLTKFCCMYRESFAPIEWSAFIEFIRSNTDLEELEFSNNGLTEQQVIELMDALQSNVKLKKLDLDGDNANSFTSLMSIARYVAKSTTIEELSINEEGITPDEAAELISVMQCNTSLIGVKPYHGYINKSEFVQRQENAYREKLEIQRKQFKYPPKPQPWQPILLPDTTNEPMIKQLSSEILQLILWQLNIKSLCAFRRTDKQYLKFTKNNTFWRNYYTTHFSCIPGDILALTELTYGLKLATASTHVDAFATPLWEEIFINSFRARDVSAKDYPTNYCMQFMEPVYRQYPQLIGTKDSGYEHFGLTPLSPMQKMKGLPYSYTWFLLFARGEAIYHLGFEKLNDGQYNGILFLTQDFSEAFDSRFDYMIYIFEWFAVKSEREFAEKCQELCEVYLAARETDNSCFISSPLSKQLDETILQPAIAIRDKVLNDISTMIDSAAKDFCNKCQSVNLKLIEDLTKLIKEFNDIPNLEIERYRQRIPKRSTLKTKYHLDNQNKHLYHNLTNQTWEVPRDDSIQYKPLEHRKKSKQSPQVALMKLYRVTLNLILMPVLKTFWLEDIKSPDYELYSFLRLRRYTLDYYKELYYSSSYVPFNHVSISKAHPSRWPMIAVGLARQVLPWIISAMNGLISGTEDDVHKLIEVLDHASILVPQQVKQFFQTLSTRLDNS